MLRVAAWCCMRPVGNFKISKFLSVCFALSIHLQRLVLDQLKITLWWISQGKDDSSPTIGNFGLEARELRTSPKSRTDLRTRKVKKRSKSLKLTTHWGNFFYKSKNCGRKPVWHLDGRVSVHAKSYTRRNLEICAGWHNFILWQNFSIFNKLEKYVLTFHTRVKFFHL